MTADLWATGLAALATDGWTARVVDAARLDDVRARLEAVLAAGELPPTTVKRVEDDLEWGSPAGLSPTRSIVVAAVARPLTQATLFVHGERRTVPIPPHYAGYHTMPRRLLDGLSAVLAPFGRHAALISPPLKTLAAGAGLTRYGRNNVAYVPGLGSYLLLAACATDAPPPDDAPWTTPLLLERCERCTACRRACPTGAIRADRFLLQTDRCLTWVNEDAAPFPAWVDPAWHTCAVGCLRCQQVCPENAAVDLTVVPPETFDEEESAAVLAAAPASALAAETREKLARCGLDYGPRLIARNLEALLGAGA